ncbi:MAG: HI0074 family nucleotidyltransferase substrate-binding subunit [Oscillospiraceae bacterium]|nr:HI0074 family nucleotidyltransferase substrate-binding subunit [Oscillospiraceae bacterium]MDD6527253.1 HI0074 family nucleotidyltransferase substrate-binding subunit [Oscillospiraceae bacterium]
MKRIYQSIADLGKQFKADKIVLFGSRARGDNRERSDIDIAVFGVSKEKQPAFIQAVGSLPTLLDFDIVFITDNTNEALMKNISQDGVIIMDKFTEKLSKFSDAIKRLEEALKEYDKYQITSSRDGVIQRFEFCTELAWKSTREYLLAQGYVDINSPKSVMKQAYADNLIDDDQAWLALLYARNLTSHIYDENTANDIFDDIKNKYLTLLKQLLRKLSK